MKQQKGQAGAENCFHAVLVRLCDLCGGKPHQRHLLYSFVIDWFPFCSNRIEMAKGGCSKEQPPFLTNETEKGRGAICPRP